jgi:tRNA (guanine-N7-)-methyltransferase
MNGMGSLLSHIENENLANVRLHLGDARDVVGRLPDGCIDRIYILFPDPWPKTRHHKRRLIQRDFTASLARIVKPLGEVRFATDWAHYAAWTLEMFEAEKRFFWAAEEAADWRCPWPGHVTTRYEAKGLGDCRPIWLRFVRSGA